MVGPGRGSQLLARRLVSAGAFVPQATGGALGDDDVTVVVPVRDRPAQLDRLLGALSGLACIVVDDASADAGATKEIAERHGARFVGLTTNVGPAGARNAGVALAHTTLVAFVDSDCVPADGWLEPLLGQFDDPLGGGGGAAHHARRWPRPLRGGTFVARPGGQGRAGAAREPRPLRAQRRPAGARRRRAGTRPLRRRAARRRGRGPGVAPGRGRLGRALCAVEHGRPRGPDDIASLPGPPGLLRHNGRAAGPAPRRGPGSRAPVRLDAGGLEPGAGPPARARAGHTGRLRDDPGPPPARARA